MTIESENIDPVDGNQPEVNVDELKAEVERLRSENEKLSNIKKGLSKDRDEWKKKASSVSESTSENYKELYQSQLLENQKILKSVREKSFDEGIKAELAKSGVGADQVGAARKLLDSSLIDFDSEELDSVGVSAAIHKLKKEYGFLFESKVQGQTPKLPKENTVRNDKEITREEFDRLSPAEKMEKARTHKIV